MNRLPRTLSMRLAPALITTAALAASARPALAQDPALTSLITRAVMLPTTADPSLSRISMDAESSASVVTTASGTRGEFKLAVKLTGLTFLNVGLSTPAKSGRGQIVLGDELPTGTKVELSGSHVWWFTDPVDVPKLSLQMTAPPTREERLAAIVSKATRNAVGFVIAPAVDYGREKFDFREEGTDIVRTGQLRESTSGSFAAGFMVYRVAAVQTAAAPELRYPWYVGVSIKRGLAWEAKPSVSECEPVADSVTLTCKDVVIGEPKETKKKSVGLEVRQRFARNFGWVPQVTYDYAAEKGRRWKAEVPIYVVGSGKDADFKLTGGFAAGWKQGEGGYAAVFVGPAFPLLPGVKRASDDATLQQAFAK